MTMLPTNGPRYRCFHVIFVLLFLPILLLTFGFEQCGPDQGGGICPDNNTCCLYQESHSTTNSGCIPSDLGALNATCCGDNNNNGGCGAGYVCDNVQAVCRAGPQITDPLVQTLPQYKLCQTDAIRYLYGFTILGDAKLGYYSSHGDLQTITNISMIERVLIVIHGAGRNADDYFCSMTAAIQQYYHDNPQQQQQKRVLLIAPRFAERQDPLIPLQNGGTSIQWENDNDNNTVGSTASWRSGGNAVFPPEMTKDSWSSFDIMDRLVEFVAEQTPVLAPEKKITIIVAGHSAGGQFVQRWSLLTTSSSKLWSGQSQFVIKGVVANPSSYAYLTAERYIHGTWQIPTTKFETCNDEYNKWKWGLELGGQESIPYVQETIETIGINGLVERFATRSMVYLAGSLDVCTIPAYDPTGWCYSHGLETTCMDDLQGRNRLGRHELYMESLRRLNLSHQYHASVIVPGVGHDHSLMFNSPEGLQVLFGTNLENAAASTEA